MTDIDPEDHRRYVQVAAILRDRIAPGKLAIGARVPGTWKTKAEFGVSIETAQKSLRVLENKGLIKKFPGIG